MNAQNNTYQQYFHRSSSKQEEENPERRHLATASDPKIPTKGRHDHKQIRADITNFRDGIEQIQDTIRDRHAHKQIRADTSRYKHIQEIRET